VAQGRAAGLVSAGSTGATLAAALLALGRLPGVRRPAVAAAIPIPTLEPTHALPPAGAPVRQVVLLDAGASADVQPELLASYAWMGTAYARLLGSPTPRVGLLNMAAEAGKGNELARAAFPLLSGVPGFVGNVEPAAVLGGAVDVVVTDGFTGNVFLKTVEALRPAPGERARSWSEAAAGVLLGVAGEVLVAHGSADAAEIRAALRAARRAVTAGLSTAVAALLGAGSPVGIA
jgi:glycerol-3-phosphate acyltransferase PlsX